MGSDKWYYHRERNKGGRLALYVSPTRALRDRKCEACKQIILTVKDTDHIEKLDDTKHPIRDGAYGRLGILRAFQAMVHGALGPLSTVDVIWNEGSGKDTTGPEVHHAIIRVQFS